MVRLVRRFMAGAICAPAFSLFAQTAALTPAQQATRTLGDSAIVRHDWKSLIAIYSPVTKAEPTNGMAWFRLGAGLEEQGDWKGATDALQQALRLQFQPGQAELRLARVLARRKMTDSAVAHLERAGAAGVPVEMITTESDLAPIRKDARYVALISRFEKARYPCLSMPEAHQFDFWVGDWVVTPWAGAVVTLGRRAENHISSDLEHCLIRERWTSATGFVGESMNFWDPNRRAWRQIWMDPAQTSLDYEGEYKDGAMRFHGWTLGPNGERLLQKLTFFNISPDTVRQLFERSADSGKTWTPTFDGRYVRIKSSSP